MTSINMNIQRMLSLLSFLLALLIILFSMMMSVGIAFGRFYTVESLDLTFKADEKRRPNVEFALPDGESGAWQKTNGINVLLFTVSNTDENGISDRDIHYRVRLFVPSDAYGAADPLGGVALNLSYGTRTVAASRMEIDKESVMYKEMGSSGWIYYFDLTTKEIVHVLNGGEASSTQMKLELLGRDAPSDYKLIIDPVYVSETGNQN